ncbi:hypothetical protein LCGC14_1994850, partial [marine sediment metagenome]
RAYTGSWDMVEWLSKNIFRIKVHSVTAECLFGVLSSLGYSDSFYGRSFASGIE